MAMPRPDHTRGASTTGSSAWPGQRREATYGPPRASGKAAQREAGRRRRRFAVVVVVPVLLMLGSIYLHTISARVEARASDLEERLARAEVEREELDVRVSELSSPDRIRSLARKKLGMLDPAGTDIEVYGRDREDGTQKGEETR